MLDARLFCVEINSESLGYLTLSHFGGHYLYFCVKKCNNATANQSALDQHEEKLVELSSELDAEMKSMRRNQKAAKSQQTTNPNAVLIAKDNKKRTANDEIVDENPLLCPVSESLSLTEKEMELGACDDDEQSIANPSSSGGANSNSHSTSSASTSRACAWHLTKLKFWPMGGGKAAAHFYQTLLGASSSGIRHALILSRLLSCFLFLF
jgi:hypothetical protein